MKTLHPAVHAGLLAMRSNPEHMAQIEELSYIEDALSTSYAYRTNGNKIEEIVVANVVKTGDTTRELKIATITFVNPVEMEDVADGTLPDNAITFLYDTEHAFDAKEEFKQGTIDQTCDMIDDRVAEILGDNMVEVQDYFAESFAPDTVAELLELYPEQVNEVLNECVLPAMGKKIFGNLFDPSKIISMKWYVVGEGEITKIYVLANYHETGYLPEYGVGSATLSTSLEDFISKNFTVSKYKNEYGFVYNAEIQGTRDDLMNAIFAANGMGEQAPEGAIRLIVDNGYLLSSTLGESHSFIVVEIGKDYIKEFSVAVKASSSDSEYIQKLNNKNDYSLSETEVHVMDGETLEYISSAQAETASYTAPSRQSANALQTQEKEKDN